MRDAPQSKAAPTIAIQPAGAFRTDNQSDHRERDLGLVMVKCPRTGQAIPTGIKIDRESFGRRPVFFSRTRCVICHTDHPWFAREAWVEEPATRVRHHHASATA